MTTKELSGEQLLRARMEQWEYGAEWIAALDEALAAAKAEGAREAVDRLKDRFWELRTKDADGFLGIKFGELYAILDEEAAR